MIKKNLIFGILIILTIVMPNSIASTRLNIENIVKKSDQSLVTDRGLPDLIIEDIFITKNSNFPDFIDYNLIIKNIGEGKAIAHVLLNIEITTVIRGHTHTDITTVIFGVNLSTNEIKSGTFYTEYDFIGNISFFAIVNSDYKMAESNYSNNFYEEVISLLRSNSKPASQYTNLLNSKPNTQLNNQQIILKFNQFIPLMIKTSSKYL